MNDLLEQQQVQRMWNHPEGASFEDWVNSRVARFSTRRYGWNTLKFRADFDPKYYRAQMHCLGAGDTGVAADTNTVPAEHFTFSTVVIPMDHEGPPHPHTNVEEVSFIIRGKLKLVLEKDGECCETVLTDRNLVSVPPGAYREEIGIDDEDVLVCMMLNTRKPIMPTYPPKHPLAKVKR